MKKVQLRKEIRLVILITCLTLTSILSALLYQAYKYPQMEEKKVSLYGYHNVGKVDYNVFLKPNSIYNTTSIGEGQYYFSNIVDYIDTVYTYEFVGERQAEITGNYEIYSVVEGYIKNENENSTLWQKQFPIVKKTSFESKDNNFSIIRNVSIRLSEYDNFAETVNREIKMNLQTKVTTYMNIELKASTDKGVIEKKMTTSLGVPLLTSSFKIVKTQVDSKPEAIEEVIVVEQPINKTMIAGYGAGIGFFILLLMGVILGTQTVKIDPYIKKLNKIFKKHGTRLVALNDQLAATNDLIGLEVNNDNLYLISDKLSKPIMKARSIDDLVRVSDEIGKPIMYESKDCPQKISEFFIMDDSCIYLLNLKENELQPHTLYSGSKENEIDINDSIDNAWKKENHEQSKKIKSKILPRNWISSIVKGNDSDKDLNT